MGEWSLNQRLKTIKKFKSPALKVVALTYKRFRPGKIAILEKWLLKRGGLTKRLVCIVRKFQSHSWDIYGIPLETIG